MMRETAGAVSANRGVVSAAMRVGWSSRRAQNAASMAWQAMSPRAPVP